MGFFQITFVFMPVSVLDSDQDILFFLTSNLRDDFSSKVTALLSEKLLRSQSREDFFMRGDSAGSFPSQGILLQCTGMGPKKLCIMKRSLQEFAVSLLHNKVPSPLRACFHAYKTLNVTEGMQCLNSSISFGSALGCSCGSQEQGTGQVQTGRNKE